MKDVSGKNILAKNIFLKILLPCISILIIDMVCDSVRSISSFFVRSSIVCHTSLQKNVNGGVEPWSLVTKRKDFGDQRDPW